MELVDLVELVELVDLVKVGLIVDGLVWRPPAVLSHVNLRAAHSRFYDYHNYQVVHLEPVNLCRAIGWCLLVGVDSNALDSIGISIWRPW